MDRLQQLIETLPVLARTNEPNRVVLIENARPVAQTAKPPAVRSQRLCLRPHTRAPFSCAAAFGVEPASRVPFLRNARSNKESISECGLPANFTNCNGVFRVVRRNSWPSSNERRIVTQLSPNYSSRRDPDRHQDMAGQRCQNNDGS
jgi:hypothetical protein